MIIDDHSRLLVGGELFYNDNACNFQKVLKNAIATYVHIPQELRIRSRGTERHSASN